MCKTSFLWGGRSCSCWYQLTAAAPWWPVAALETVFVFRCQGLRQVGTKRPQETEESKWDQVLFFPFPLLWVNTRLQVNADWTLSPTKSQLITTNRMVLPSLCRAHTQNSPDSRAIWLCDGEAKTISSLFLFSLFLFIPSIAVLRATMTIGVLFSFQ